MYNFKNKKNMNLKIFFLLLIFSYMGLRGIAQPIFLQQEKDCNGYISFAKLRTDTVPQFISKSAEFLKNLYAENKTCDFRLSKIRNQKKDEFGCMHQYYHQYYRNVRIEHSEVGVHSNPQGIIEMVSGFFHTVGDVDVEAKLSEEQALKYALAHICAEVYKWQIFDEEQWIKEHFNDTYYPVGELVIVNERLKSEDNYRLAYRFDIYAHKPMSRDYIWVDAITGNIICVASRIRFTNTTGWADTRYSQRRSLTTDSNNGSFRLRATKNNGSVNISTFNMNHTGNYTNTDFTDNNNDWTTAEHQANNNNAGLDAHWGAEMVYEYFKQNHARNSWNNSNGSLLSYVNANLVSLGYTNSNNAFWDGNKMTYGQGTTWPPVVTLDIVAHEIGHGITESEANLKYEGESGAINESISDIWGACVEFWAANNKQRWLIGEDLGAGNILRNMSNPNLFGQPDTHGGINWWNPTNLTWDNGGVHRNSGVMNFWFFLLTEGGNGTNDIGNAYSVEGIGINAASRIVYKALTDYMGKNETFTLARTHTIEAARYLYGNNSPEIVAVTNAWHAVGVGDRYPITLIRIGNLCSGSTLTFNVISLPFGATTVWSKPSFLGIPQNVTNNSATYTVNTTNTELLKSVTANISLNGNNIETVSSFFNVNDHRISISGANQVSYLKSETYTLSPQASNSNLCPISGSYYEWHLNNTLISLGSTAIITIQSVANPISLLNNLFPIDSTNIYGSSEDEILRQPQVPYGAYTLTATRKSSSGSVLGTTSKVIAIYGYPKIIVLTPVLVPITPPNNPENITVQVYPNPTGEIFNIEIEPKTTETEQIKYEVRLYDNLGSILKKEKTTSCNLVQFNVSTLQNGFYYLHILNADTGEILDRQQVEIKR